MPTSNTNTSARRCPPPKAVWWIVTIPVADWEVPSVCPEPVAFMCGQKEEGGETGYTHWQVYVCLKRQSRMGPLKALFGRTAHLEPTKSDAARAYCLKEDTAIAGSRFHLGEEPIRRNNGQDWALIKTAAKLGHLDDIPDDIYIR